MRLHTDDPSLINDLLDHKPLVLAIGMKSGADKGGVVHRPGSTMNKLRNSQGECPGSHVCKVGEKRG